MNAVKKSGLIEGFQWEAIANWYAKLTLKDLNRHQLMALQLVKKIPACGRELEIARNHAVRAGIQVDFQQGNASDRPFEDETFDFISCRAVFKNFSQPVLAIAEMYHVCIRAGAASS